MFWLTRPPYFRWTLAALVVVGGVILEFAPESSVRHPFAVEPITVGEQIDQSRVRWRDVPVGLLSPVELPVTATRRIEAGEPILGAVVDPTRTGAIPAGWWAIEVDVPSGARPGMAVRIVSYRGTTEGVVVDVREDGFGEQRGLVAVTGDQATAVAEASLEGTVAILLGG